jgi:hypothetical protein
VSSWHISIPYRSSADSLSAVAEAARELPTAEERTVVRQLVLSEITDGSASTAGELIDSLERSTPAERRELLDQARVKAGLPDTRTVEARRRMETACRAAGARAAADKRPMRIGLSPAGVLIDLNDRDDEIARERARQESSEQVRKERNGERAIEAEHARAANQAYADAVRRELPDGVPG